MSRLTVVDNNSKKLSLSQYNHDYRNLRKIANKTIGELQSESGILIFPPRVEDTDDQIKESIIFNLTENDESFSLKTGNIMGFIGRNETELNICSRFTHSVNGEVSEKNDYFLHYMLEKVCHVNLSNLKSSNVLDNIFDFLPYLFPQYLIAALKQGLYKEYQTREYNDSNVRGVIDINRHIRFNIPANGKIAYRTREYSFDNPVTELVRHTIEYMRSSDNFKLILTRNEETKAAVSKIDNATPSYNLMNRNAVLSKTTKTIKSPYFHKYRDLQKICRMILLREKIKYDSSANKIYGILFDGAWLWEEYLATLLKPLDFVHPENKKKNGVIHPFIGTNIGHFYPDFYKPRKDDEKEAEIIFDAKYKNFDTSNPLADDLAQMISYIHVMNAGIGKFIYPSKNSTDRSATWTLRPFANISAEIGTLLVYIPQNEIKDYKQFCEKINDSEKNLNVLAMGVAFGREQRT